MHNFVAINKHKFNQYSHLLLSLVFPFSLQLICRVLESQGPPFCPKFPPWHISRCPPTFWCGIFVYTRGLWLSPTNFQWYWCLDCTEAMVGVPSRFHLKNFKCTWICERAHCHVEGTCCSGRNFQRGFLWGYHSIFSNRYFHQSKPVPLNHQRRSPPIPWWIIRH